jgi:hypothetical protein
VALQDAQHLAARHAGHLAGDSTWSNTGGAGGKVTSPRACRCQPDLTRMPLQRPLATAVAQLQAHACCMCAVVLLSLQLQVRT